ncbi:MULTISPECIES: glycoside hydrolase family 44 protein [Paenibacillus]|uniref:glycoside hydrolase family 44 protein n=1 Tax=Paenibacillus TaxID=44249 RepID=UPI002FE3048C
MKKEIAIPARSRWTATALAFLMLFSSFFAAEPQAALAKTEVTATATGESGEVQPGSSTTIQVHITSSESTALMLDLGIYDASLKRVDRIIIDPVHVVAGETKTVPVVWNIPATLARGDYIVSFGVFGSGWSSNVDAWFAGAAQLKVGGGGTGPVSLPAPTGLTAEPQQAAIALQWNSVTGATYYELEADGAVLTLGAVTNYRHTGLEPDTQHGYRIRARNAETASEWSPLVTARTLSDVTTPASDIKVEVSSDPSDPSTSMLGPNFTVTNTGSRPIKLGDLKVRYYFTVDDEDIPLNIGFWSTVAKESVVPRFITMPIPSAKADTYLELGFKPEAGNLSPGGSVIIGSWIYKKDYPKFDQSNDYSFTGSKNSMVTAKVPAYLNDKRVWGEEPEPLDMPSSPTGIEASPTDTAITLSWQPVDRAVSYVVKADGIPHEVEGTSFTHEWLRTGSRHTYKVKTKTATQESAWSGLVTVKTTGEQAIAAPVNIRATKTDTSIKLTWGAPPDAEITGYDIEVDGQVSDNGLETSYAHENLEPGSAHTYRVRAKENATLGAWTDLLTQNTTRTPTGPFDVRIDVDTSKDRAPISPYIYGTNDDLTNTEKWTSRRVGGNRLTTYNWENNASNSGHDENYHSDYYVAHYYGGVPWSAKPTEPGIGISGFHQKSLQYGAYTLASLQIAGYAAKDADGYVREGEQAPSARWVEVKPEKGAPFDVTPNLNDNAVYMDEMVNYLVKKHGDASAKTGIRGYELDNEPGLWVDNHKYIHPGPAGAEEVLNKGLSAAKAVKKVDPHAEIFGPATFGFDDMYSMQAAPDWPQVQGNYDWYLDYYLDKFRVEREKPGGKRLLDVLDIHWYPETSAGGHRIQELESNNVLETNLARMQAPRQLWDPSYSESNSRFFLFHSQFFPLIPKLRQSIDTYYPGTKLAFTEYNYGAENNVYGGIAQADVLGIYGKYGVYMAHFWRMTGGVEPSAYITLAMRLYNDYDGNHSKFGDTKVKAETSDIENSSVYGSVYRDSDDNLHLIVLNKNNDFEMNASFNIAGGTRYKSARVWAFDGENAAITERQPVSDIENNKFTYKIPKLTACHIVLSTN